MPLEIILQFTKLNKDVYPEKGKLLVFHNVYENTINKQSFISPNWRAFDLIYWMSQRSIRKSSKKGTLQNAFAFYETALGFNYKSLDSMIEDIVDQDEKDTDVNQNKPKLHLVVHENQCTSSCCKIS